MAHQRSYSHRKPAGRSGTHILRSTRYIARAFSTSRCHNASPIYASSSPVVEPRQTAASQSNVPPPPKTPRSTPTPNQGRVASRAVSQITVAFNKRSCWERAHGKNGMLGGNSTGRGLAARTAVSIIRALVLSVCAHAASRRPCPTPARSETTAQPLRRTSRTRPSYSSASPCTKAPTMKLTTRGVVCGKVEREQRRHVRSRTSSVCPG